MPRPPAPRPAPFPGPPIYYQIARLLEGRIYHGLYRPGEAIPSETELSHEFGVTRLTVRQALQQLTTHRLLVPRRGSGTYVSDQPRVPRPVNFLGYLDDQALQPLTMDIELARVEEMPAPDEVRQHLRLPSKTRVLLVERIRSLQGLPMNRAVNYLPAPLARRLPLDRLIHRSMTDLVREFGGVSALSASQTLTAEGAPADVAQRLRLAPGAPVLRSDFLVRDGARPVNYSVVHYRPDQTFFTASLISLPSMSARPTTQRINGRPAARGVRADERR